MLRGNGRDLFFAKCIAVIHLVVSILLAVAVALFIASYNKENGRKLFCVKTKLKYVLLSAFLTDSHKFSFLQISSLTAWAITQMASTILYIIGLEKVRHQIGVVQRIGKYLTLIFKFITDQEVPAAGGLFLIFNVLMFFIMVVQIVFR